MNCKVCGTRLKRVYSMLGDRSFVCPKDARHTNKEDPKEKSGFDSFMDKMLGK